MIEAKLAIVDALGEGFFRELASELDVRVGERMSYWANKLLDEELSKSEGTDRPYTINIDGQAAKSRDQFPLARRRIRIYFINEAIALAAATFANVLRQEVAATVTGSKKIAWVNRSGIDSSVQVFYGKAGGAIGPAPTTIQNFEPGDVILILPKYGTQMFANAKKFGPSGIFARAVKQIRTKLKLTGRSKQTPITVTAQRSRAAFYKMMGDNAPVRPDGTPINVTTPWAGADSMWVIAIRYRKNYKGSVL